MEPLQWIFIVLKLIGAINWPWPAVLLPVEIEAGFAVLMLLVMAAFGIGFFRSRR